MKKIEMCVLAAGLLTATPVLAADPPLPRAPHAPQPAPLPAGKAAGLSSAQQKPVLGLALIGSAGIIAIIAVVAGSSGNGQASPQMAPSSTTGR